MELPKLNPTTRRIKREVVQMRGINYSDQLQDGDLVDSYHLSTRRYPYISTDYVDSVLSGYYKVTALTSWNGLVFVKNDGTDESPDYELYYRNWNGQATKIGAVTGGEKQFAAVNTKLVIWPDKKYLDTTNMTLHDLGASATSTGSTFTENKLELTGVSDLTSVFSKGDGLTITACSIDANKKTFVVKEVTADTITATTDDAFTEGDGGAVTIAREVPDMDFICESENRLWGCSSASQTIYASANGDPCNFNVFEGTNFDSYAVAVGSEGDFTGCCKLSSTVLFWKERVLHKMLGTYPAEYQLYTYTIEGLRKGCHKSQQVINDVLIYIGLHGVHAYSGNTPSLISANFGERRFTDAVAGNDGNNYFLSCREVSASTDTYNLFVYDTQRQIWLLRETGNACVDFARTDDGLYYVSSGMIHSLDTAGALSSGAEWKARFAPFYETIEGRKRYSKLLFRLELPATSSVTFEVREDGGNWHTAKTVTGGVTDVIRVRVPIIRCDKWELRITGYGACTILSFLREFFVGGEQ